MKKMYILISLIFLIIFSACIDDPFNYKQCTSSTYPLYCDDYGSCCPSYYPYNCNGVCYMTFQAAWDSCGKYGWYIDKCYVE